MEYQNVYRIAVKGQDNLSGIGCTIADGRWSDSQICSEKNLRAVYASQSKALASLEFLEKLLTYVVPVPPLQMMVINIPTSFPESEYDYLGFGGSWPISERTSRSIGTTILEENEFLFLKVPSIIVDEEYNYLINVQHPRFKEITFRSQPFTYHPKLTAIQALLLKYQLGEEYKQRIKEAFID